MAELLTDKADSLHHTLFYCALGRIDPVLELLTNLGLRVAKFTAEESAAERQELLKMFASGHLQALVAMRCLDEGVDVPSTRTAYILASSSNPKEFIQRRGRILRQSSGKEYAEIHDLIAVPPMDYRQYPTATFRTERKIVGRELERFNEFAGMALNKFEARDKIWELAKKLQSARCIGGILMENMENKVEKFRQTLPPAVNKVIDRVLKVELEKLDMKRPQGIKREIRRIIQEEVRISED